MINFRNYILLLILLLPSLSHADNDPFEETIRYNSRYNRLILFDGSNYHASNPFNHDDDKEERLTLITFFNSVDRIDDSNLKQPVTTMRRIN